MGRAVLQDYYNVGGAVLQAQETETADSPVPTDVEFSGRCMY